MQELENYKKEKLTVDLVWANIFGIIMLIPTSLIFGLPYYLIWQPKIHIKQFWESNGPLGFALSFLLIYLILILGIVLHELIHGIIWAKFAKQGFKSIKFGVVWNMLTPYSHCKEPFIVKQYIIGGIAPGIILGIIPATIAIIIGNLGLVIFGIYFTIAASGDILIINLIRKENSDSLVQDHPSEAGCYIYRDI